MEVGITTGYRRRVGIAGAGVRTARFVLKNTNSEGSGGSAGIWAVPVRDEPVWNAAPPSSCSTYPPTIRSELFYTDIEKRQAQRRECSALFCHPPHPQTDRAPVRV